MRWHIWKPGVFDLGVQLRQVPEGGESFFPAKNVDVVGRRSMNFCLECSTTSWRGAARTGTAEFFSAPFHRRCAQTLHKIKMWVFRNWATTSSGGALREPTHEISKSLAPRRGRDRAHQKIRGIFSRAA
jgi:hypothetical protein